MGVEFRELAGDIGPDLPSSKGPSTHPTIGGEFTAPLSSSEDKIVTVSKNKVQKNSF